MSGAGGFSSDNEKRRMLYIQEHYKKEENQTANSDEIASYFGTFFTLTFLLTRLYSKEIPSNIISIATVCISLILFFIKASTINLAIFKQDTSFPVDPERFLLDTKLVKRTELLIPKSETQNNSPLCKAILSGLTTPILNVFVLCQIAISRMSFEDKFYIASPSTILTVMGLINPLVYATDYFLYCVKKNRQEKIMKSLIKDLGVSTSFTPIKMLGESSLWSYWTIKGDKTIIKLLATQLRNVGIVIADQEKGGLILSLPHLSKLSLQKTKEIIAHVLRLYHGIIKFNAASQTLKLFCDKIKDISHLKLTLFQSNTPTGMPLSIYAFQIPERAALSEADKSSLIELFKTVFLGGKIEMLSDETSGVHSIQIELDDFSEILEPTEPHKSSRDKIITKIQKTIEKLFNIYKPIAISSSTAPNLRAYERLEGFSNPRDRTISYPTDIEMSKPRTPPRVFGGVGVGAGSGTSAGTSAGTFGTPAKPLTTIQWQIPGVAQSIFYTDEAHHSPNLVALSSEIFPERRVFALWDVAANKKIPDETIQRAREIFENGQVVAPKGQQGFVYNTTTEGGRWKLKIKGALGYMRVYPHETPFRAATGESLVRFTSIAPGH